MRFTVWNLLLLTLVCGVWCGNGNAATPDSLPSDAEIRAILSDKIDNQRQSVGIVVGILDPQGRRIIAHGAVDKNDTRPLNGDTIFEIGGITKVFTGLLLADMVKRHEVALADPIVKYLPNTLKLNATIQQITLEDLATHTSGFPRNPTNLLSQDPANPYADYTVKQLYDFLSGFRVQRSGRSESEYSNVGFGVLGQVLALRSGISYEALVHTRVAVPLGMKSTGITLSRDMITRLAVGHNGQLNSVPNWEFQSLAGAGALRSTANDLLTLLAAEMDYSHSGLAPAMATMVKVRRPTTTPGLENAIGWQIGTLGGNEIIQKDGAALNGGYATFIAFNPKTRVGVVVLSNAFVAGGISDLALHLLDQGVPLRGKLQKVAAVDPKLFDGYIGRYQMSPNVVLTVSSEGGHLFAQMTGQPKFEVFPQSNRNYFYKNFDAQLSFEPDSERRAIAVVWYYNGKISRALRIDTPPPVPK